MAGSQAADREGRIIILGAPGHHGANMKPIISIAVHDWHAPVSSELATHALDALEAGSVLRLPLPFTLSADEQSLLSPELLRSEEHTSELQSLLRISYAVFCLKKKNNHNAYTQLNQQPKSNVTMKYTNTHIPYTI